MRGVKAQAERWLEVLQQRQARCPRLVEETEKAFRQHPDAEVLLSLPGLTSNSVPASSPKLAATQLGSQTRED
ncbi:MULTISPECIES: hypothetical protein [Streptomyces]|uniref:hypothetical protein n=1 Tax=Streptomyces TaxID=1883 RepID=UPI000A379622|nr:MULTISPECIES: hypothetical protein [Streptomyces]MDX3583137.1 hypothetical protein [Streptomyces europaeiscabiei]MDX3613826.1 hypothetical protein [Streptomyces europaeiscabiei]MDX3633965.1 hypothetical protein [Streptomyces europaeiscabiei]MDX3651428.1 hypothetical protein [Streptomyces europaeiscabiei]WUD35338.1 hypothetical protein OG858_30610 [Streptomyces europaeiscabiei]